MERVDNWTDVPVYEYQPLRSEANEIRILILEPSYDHELPLRVSFELMPIGEGYSDTFEALSYTWGAPRIVHQVVVADAYKLRITENLDRALRRLRKKIERRRLWVDALCINQADDKEKSDQIPLMYKIFRSARTVLAWLGAGEQTATAGMKCLSRLSRWPKVEFGDRETLDTLGTHVSKTDIAAILSLPWFSRMWIIQEVVFQIDVLLIYGDTEISWVRLSTALGLYKKTREETENAGKLDQELQVNETIFSLWKQHSMFESEHGLYEKANILDLLRQFSYHQCSDPRDRIFALYNMAADIERPWTKLDSESESGDDDVLPQVPVNIDYSLDVKETYHSFASACAKADRIVPLLQAIIERNNFTDPTQWASWVPDWRLMPVPTKSWYLLRRAVPSARLPMAPLKFVGLDKHRLLLESQSCCANASRIVPEGPFVPIDTIAPTRSCDGAVTFLQAAVNFYHANWPNPRTWWVSKEKFFAELLATLLELNSDMSQILQHHLLKYSGWETPRQPWELPDDYLRDAIEKAMQGKTLFAARILGSSVTFSGITGSSIHVGDQLLIDANVATQTERNALIPAIILRQTPTSTPDPDTSSDASQQYFHPARVHMKTVMQRPRRRQSFGPQVSSTSSEGPVYSFRVVGGALLSWPISNRSDGPSYQEYESEFVHVKDLLSSELLPRRTHVRFWLE